MKELIGKKITGLFVDSEDQGTLMFKSGEEELVYTGYGDCCSETWFADITGVDCLIGFTVISVESVELNDVFDERTRQEHDEVYGYKIKTNKGYVDIIYRNSSNGYYGGDCEFGGKPTKNMVEITDDWNA